MIWASYPDSTARNFKLAVVSDGIGGLAHGGDAASIALSVFVSRVLRTSQQLPADRLINATLAANSALFDQFQGRAGATLSAVFIGGNGAKIGVNVGDSRIYGITETKDFLQLSRDDTLAGVLGENKHEAQNYKKLIQYVGMGEGIEPNKVDIGRNDIDIIAITTDGIHGSPKGVLSELVKGANSEIELSHKLILLSDLLGGHDNGTVIAIRPDADSLETDGGQGLILTLLSAISRLEVWIPMLGDEARQERSSNLPPTQEEHSSFRAQTQGLVAQSGPTQVHRLLNKRKKKPRARGPREGRGSSEEEQNLPLDDAPGGSTLDVKFPPSK